MRLLIGNNPRRGDGRRRLRDFRDFHSGLAQAARICATEGVPAELLDSVLTDTPHARWIAKVMASGDFANPGASIKVWRDALTLIQGQAAERHMTCELPDFAAQVLDRAIGAGFGAEHIAAIVKVMGVPIDA